MSDLIFSADIFDRMRGDLNRLVSEFENANAHSDSVADSVGHPHLADKVRGFATNWEHRRQDLVDQIKTIEKNMAKIHKEFDKLDHDFASGLSGDH